MTNNSLIDDLQELGQNIYEAKVCLVLTGRSLHGAVAAAQVSSLSPARLYNLFHSLSRRGLVSLKLGKQLFNALDLKSFRQKLIADSRGQCKLREQKIERMSQKLKKKLDKIYTRENTVAPPLQYIEVINNPFQAHKRFQRIAAESKEEILAFRKPPYPVNLKQLVNQFKQHVELRARGLSIKSIYEITRDEDERPWCLEMIETAVKGGEEVRAVEGLPMKMAVIDEQIVIYTFEAPSSRKTAVATLVVRDRSLAKSLKLLFETIWDEAMDYRQFGNGGS